MDDYKAGIIDRAQAIGSLAHVIAAVDIGNYSEARVWLEQGRKLVRDGGDEVGADGDETMENTRPGER